MKRRRPIRTAILLIGLCLTLWRLPSTIESFAATMGSGGTPTQSLLAALNSAAGGASAQSAEAHTKKEPADFADGGRELTEEERERMLKRARALAPPPLDSDAKVKPGEKASPADQRKALEELQKQFDLATGAGKPR